MKLIASGIVLVCWSCFKKEMWVNLGSNGGPLKKAGVFVFCHSAWHLLDLVMDVLIQLVMDGLYLAQNLM